MTTSHDLWRGICAYCDFGTGDVVALEIAERLLLEHARVAHPEIERPDFEYVRAQATRQALREVIRDDT